MRLYLRIDGEREYNDPKYFETIGLVHETITPYMARQHGAVERKNIGL